MGRLTDGPKVVVFKTLTNLFQFLEDSFHSGRTTVLRYSHLSRSIMFYFDKKPDRLSSVYDVTSLTQSYVNPNLRGLDHPGWGDHGNPTNCIRFRLNGTSVAMNYKKIESDSTWLPKAEFDEGTHS